MKRLRRVPWLVLVLCLTAFSGRAWEACASGPAAPAACCCGSEQGSCCADTAPCSIEKPAPNVPALQPDRAPFPIAARTHRFTAVTAAPAGTYFFEPQPARHSGRGLGAPPPLRSPPHA